MWEALDGNTAKYRALASDGERLWAVRIGDDDQPQAIVRLDPDTGEELASHPLDSTTLPNWQLTSQPLVADFAMTSSGLWILESETSLRHLDSDDLADLGAVELTPGPKYVGTSGGGDELWVSQMRLLGRGSTDEVVRRYDAASGELVEEFAYPNCGARAAAATRTRVWVSVLCQTQLSITDRESGESSVVGPFPAPATFTITDSLMWTTYDQIGVVAAHDHESVEVIASFDLDVDGAIPTLDEAAGPFVDGEWVVALGRPQDETDPPSLARFDSRTGEILGRRLIPGFSPTVALLRGRGFLAGLDGGIATFQPIAITGDADPDVLVISPSAVDRFEPTTDDELAAVAAFDQVFSEDVAIGTAAIENGAAHEATWIVIAAAAAAFPDAQTIVTSMFVSDDRADITYSVILDGVPAFIPLAGYLVRDPSGVWRLSEQTFCDFASAALVPCT